MRRKGQMSVLGALSIVLLWAALPGAATAQSLFGTLSNFDVFNDTGQACHGFEIELDGLTSKDVVYSFSSPNSQYPAPKLTDFSGGVYVDYESPWDPATQKFILTTPVPLAITPTLGHQCWYGASVPGGNKYPNVGCEHFGLSLIRNPTAVHYRWLVADPITPGLLKKWGTDVTLPAPTWTITPPPPVPNPPPPVIVAIAPPPPEIPDKEVEPQFGDAVWIKTFVTQQKEHAVLNKMVQNGDDDPLDSETEVEMRLSQNGPPGAEKEIEEQQPLGVGQNALIRRYEVYKYLGGYDPESHEALCDDAAACPEAVGDYIGSNIAAANLVPGVSVAASVSTSAFLYSRVTKQYSGFVTVKNTTGVDIVGPVEVVFVGLPATLVPVNQAGTFLGSPYIIVPTLADATKKLPNNTSVTFAVQFKGTGAVSSAPAVYSGSLQPQ